MPTDALSSDPAANPGLSAHSGLSGLESPSPELPAQTLWARLSDVAAATPHKEALLGVDAEGNECRVTYEELVQHTGRLAVGLTAIGVRRGDRVGLIMTSRLEWVYTCFAAMQIGAVLVPVNTRLVFDEIAGVLRDARVRHLVILDRFRQRNYCAELAATCPEWLGSARGHLFARQLPELRNVVVSYRGRSEYQKHRNRQDRIEHGEPASSEVPGCWDFDRLTGGPENPARSAAVDMADHMARQVRPDDIAMIKYTSGSTGFPKGAMLSQSGCVRAALLSTARMGTTAQARWFSAMPFFHVGGSVWGLFMALLEGATIVFTEAYDPQASVGYAARERCTAIYGVPTMIRDYLAVLRDQDLDLSAIRLVSATDRALVEELRARIPSVTTPINAFGLTETFGPFAVLAASDSWDKKATTCGRLLPGNQIRVVDPDTGKDVSPGEPGEGLLRGGIMTGYWDAAGQAARGIDDEGWFHSGDLVSVDGEGYVRWLGRLKAMLKVGGENVSAEEVENCLLAHDDILECAVVGIHDPRLDQVPVAYVVPQRGRDIVPEHLAQWCAGRLARFKIPRKYVVMETLPRIGSGKLDRTAIQAMADQG